MREVEDLDPKKMIAYGVGRKSIGVREKGLYEKKKPLLASERAVAELVRPGQCHFMGR